MADSKSWPIAAAMLPFPPVDSRGQTAQDADPSRWLAALQEVRGAGFTEVDLTDCWLKPGNLSSARLTNLREVLKEAELAPVAISAIRCSIIDPDDWKANLAYSHRTIEAAAALGVDTVSFGLHRPLTTEQSLQLWFWSVPGPRDDPDDRQAWANAVERYRELADHAREVGVALSLEMYEDTFLGTADSATRLVTEIGRDNVGLNPDLGNLIRVHVPIEPWQQMVQKVVPFANYWHVKNYGRSESRSGVILTSPSPMESGLINYRWAVRFALAAGFTGAFCVEHYGGDSLGVASVNLSYLRGLIGESLDPDLYW
jgi:sugar phosphate isomerase/epimerase